MTGGYDDGYGRCGCFCGTTPGSYVQRLAQITPLAGAKVLDAGTGEGKNALYMNQQGAANVLAVDISSLAIRNATQAHGAVPGITWRVADVCAIDLQDAAFNVVIAYGLFHCLHDVEELTALVRRLKLATKPTGYHVICAFNDRAQRFNGAHRGFSPLLVSHANYLHLYAEWAVIAAEDADLHETHPHELIPHSHSVTRILSQKPGNDDDHMP